MSYLSGGGRLGRIEAIAFLGASTLMSGALGTGRTPKVVTAGYEHTGALLDDGQVKCWGNNLVGALGLGDTKTPGGDHTCALLDTGDVKCWGSNARGELGLGDTTNRGTTPDSMGDNLPPVVLW